MIRTANLIGSVSRKAGGLHESVRRLVQSLATTGVGVHVLAVEDEFTQVDLGVWDPVPVDVFPATWPASFGYSPGFIRVLNEYHPDVTHTHGIWMYPSIATAAYCTRRRVPYMISPHGMLDPWAIRHHLWKKVLAYAIFETNHVRGARCIRALCDSEARDIRQLKLKNPIAVIPNGIDLPNLHVATETHVNGPFAGLIDPGQKILLFLGRIHPKKGLTNLLKAWAAIRKSNGGGSRADEWELAIAGWDQGGYQAQLLKLAEQLDITFVDVGRAKSDNAVEHKNADQRTSVLFLGPKFGSQKEACYRACAAFILPSLSEGLPMAVLEAWAYAKPALITAECNLPEGFAAGAALRIDSTVAGISEGLRQLYVTTPANLLAMGARGRRGEAGRHRIVHHAGG